MFDPLDLYTADCTPPDVSKGEVFAPVSTYCSLKISNQGHYDLNDQDLPIDSLDLPLVHYASPEVILCILLLLKPAAQINFQKGKSDEMSVAEMRLQNGISKEMMNSTLSYYKTWGNSRLETEQNICKKIPALVSVGESLLNYYTLVLKHYENSTCSIKDQIVKEVSMRISENCGRTAQPSMSRQFTFKNLEICIEIYEPSLTADNLGWKTWGSSFILSQKLVHCVAQIKPSRKMRVLELGSGTGLAGITWLAKWVEVHGRHSIEMFFTDLKEIVPNLRENVAINGLAANSIVDTLDWTKPADFMAQYSKEKFDIIIVSDPIYSPEHPRLVVDVVSQLLSTNGTCHFEMPLRNKYTRERHQLWRFLNERGLQVTEQERDEGVDDWGQVNYMYQRIQWKC